MGTAPRTILVTGANGHLGNHLCRQLLAAGQRVRAMVHRRRDALEGLDLERITADVTDGRAFEGAARGCDWILHAAARIDLDDRALGPMSRVNQLGTLNAVAAARAAGARLVHVSSIEALEPFPLQQRVDETRALTEHPAFAYGSTKAEAERTVRSAIGNGLDAVIVNPTAMLGPEDHGPSHAGRMIQQLIGRELPALVTGGFDWVDVRDVASAIIAAAARAPTGARYLLGGRWRSLRDLARMVCAEAGCSPPPTLPRTLAWIGLPFATAWSRLTSTTPRFTRGSLTVLAEYRDVDHSRATRELGYAPRPLEDTVADTVAWFREGAP